MQFPRPQVFLYVTHIEEKIDSNISHVKPPVLNIFVMLGIRIILFQICGYVLLY